MNLPVNYNSISPSMRRQVREQYVIQQQGKCSHCGAALVGPPAQQMFSYKINRRLFPKGFFDHPVHLHHSHKTGMTLGAVHNICNAVLWQYHGE